MFTSKNRLMILDDVNLSDLTIENLFNKTQDSEVCILFFVI
jgi:hypothetical protein